MPQIPSWLLGRHVTAISVTGATADALGNLSQGTQKSLQTSLQGVRLSVQRRRDEISAVTSPRANNVYADIDSSVILTEILKRSGENILVAIARDYDYVYITFSRNQTWAGYFLVGDYEEAVDNKGRNVGTLSVFQVDDGAGPVYG